MANAEHHDIVPEPVYEADRRGVKCKYESYQVLHWDFNSERSWAIYLPFVFDLGMFIWSCFLPNSITILDMGVRINFLTSICMILFYFTCCYLGPQKELNWENAKIDIQQERKNLVK